MCVILHDSQIKKMLYNDARQQPICSALSIHNINDKNDKNKISKKTQWPIRAASQVLCKVSALSRYAEALFGQLLLVWTCLYVP